MKIRTLSGTILATVIALHAFGASGTNVFPAARGVLQRFAGEDVAEKKGTDGKSLACFFYGYTWELGGVPAGAAAHLYAEPGKAVVCASEGYVVVQARREGPLELDFGDACTVSDALTGASIGSGPAISVPFKVGETRVFKAGHVE